LYYKIRTVYRRNPWKNIVIQDYGVSNIITLSEYDGLGNLDKVINPEGHVLDYTYNSLGWMVSKDDPNSGTVNNEYDQNGNVILFESADDKKNMFEYDTLNRLTVSSDSLGNPVHYRYGREDGTPMDKVTQITDQAGTRKVEYDGRGRVKREVFTPKCGCSSGCVDINEDGKIDIQDHSLFYSGDGVPFENRDFNGNGNLEKFSGGIDESCFLSLYDEYYGREYTEPFCRSDEEVRCTTNEKWREYAYDYSDNLIRVDDSEGNYYTYSYDNIGRLTEVGYNGNIISQDYVYNPSGSLRSFNIGEGESKIENLFSYYNREVDLVRYQMSTSSDGIVFRREYTYDNVNNLIEEKRTKTAESSIRYSYDPLYRLSVVLDGSDDIYPGVFRLEYEYDDIGNREKKRVDGAEEIYEYNSGNSKLNSIVREGGDNSEYGYDVKGNIIWEKFNGQLIKKFDYNSFNQLSKVTFPSTGNCIRYYYDNNGNRFREENGITNIITQYHYDFGGKLVSDLKWHGSVACNSVCGNGVVEEGETCDFALPTSKVCKDFENSNRRFFNDFDLVSCNNDCGGYDISECVEGYPGDGILEHKYEQCDGQVGNWDFWSWSDKTVYSTSTAASCSLIHNGWDSIVSKPVGCDFSSGRLNPSGGSFHY
jgi:YD repeat-containing protein